MIRDFAPSYADMNKGNGPIDTSVAFVSSTLGPNSKPVYAGGAASVQSAASFANWWNTVNGVNMQETFPLTLSNGTEFDPRVRLSAPA